MYFSITFRGVDGFAVSIDGRPVGISGVDIIRNQANMPKLSVDPINPWINGIDENPMVEIPEKVARDSGMFDKLNKLDVTVPPAALNGFTYLQAQIKRDTETGEITSARLVYKLDEQLVIDKWVNDGCPIEWAPERELTD